MYYNILHSFTSLTFEIRQKDAGEIGVPTFLVLDKRSVLEYNKMLSQGPVMVSTGVLRYDKRGGPDKPDKLSNFKK